MKNELVEKVNEEQRETINNEIKERKLYFIVKRLIDIILASSGMLFLFPIFLLVSVLCLFGKNKGPVFFKQLRVGKNGEQFYIYKFRSMIVNAEQVLKSNSTLYKKYLENNYKLEQHEDPRITKVGALLRKTSIDEIPQLINVIRGEMSLVGPRPVVPEELIEYDLRLKDFLGVKPGVTGYWQICGRSDVGYPERANLEFYYVDNQSGKLDAHILLKTIVLVFNRTGAY